MSQEPSPSSSPPDLRPLRVFAYTVEAQAALYRVVVRVFAEAKARYRVQLRPDEIAPEVRRLGYGDLLPADGLDRALDQLVEWGNLRRGHDTGRVASLEDFRRRHFVYQLTPAGEAAERAVGAVLLAIENSGSLQTVMLGAILRNLTELADELATAEPTPARLFEALFNIGEQFRALTENASTFLTGLHAAIDAGEVHAEAFVVYKQAVIAYLERFVGELGAIAPQVTRQVRRVETAGVLRMIEIAAAADRAPTLEAGPGVGPAAQLAQEWRGVAAWFVGEGRERPTVESLRSAALQAINRILLVLERLHEKRFRRIDRTADLLRLAVWFEALGARGDPDAVHRLYQNAFGLFGARHFGGLHEDPERIRPGASWWQAPPVPVAPVLRQMGRTSLLGRMAQIEDHWREKRLLAERHRRERDDFLAALTRFAGHGPLALADLPRLAPSELRLLLGLLDRLLARPAGPGGRRVARSRDGRLLLTLDPPVAGETAGLETALGRLTLPAWVLTVEDRLAERLAAAG
ncbi:MAG TPA: TIGR02677 family protein [Thermoanaerobaculia bacterium]|nr:TIGR02677 family protein [Thermoanaerobaculia bacterium]